MSVLLLKNCNLQIQPDLSRSNATNLSLAGNSIYTIFNEYLPRNLTRLDLGNNYLADDGIPFHLPDSIEELLLDSNHFHELDGIHWPTSLRLLILDNNCIRTLPTGLPNTLEKLLVRYTHIKEITTLPANLKELIANHTLINKLPKTINLEILEAHSNHLPSKGIPFNWGTNLRILNLSSNRLTAFPSNLPDSLEQLFLNDNQIQSVPELPLNLQVLSIGHNRVKTIELKKRVQPLSYAQLTNNNLVFSVMELQIVSNETLLSKSIDEGDNWYLPNYLVSATMIKRLWRRFRLLKTLRTWLKTARVKQELLATSMHPSRFGQFENVEFMTA